MWLRCEKPHPVAGCVTLSAMTAGMWRPIHSTQTRPCMLGSSGSCMGVRWPLCGQRSSMSCAMQQSRCAHGSLTLPTSSLWDIHAVHSKMNGHCWSNMYEF